MPPGQPLLIFPYNGNGREATDCLGIKYELIAFIDDTPQKWGTDEFGRKVLDRDGLRNFPNALVIAIPGSPTSYRQRRQVIEGLGVEAGRYATIIHPEASVSRRSRIGFNVLIMAGVVITSGATIGNHVCILPNTVIHHDASVADWTMIGSGVTVAGGACIGENCYIGSGSNIMHGIHIGDRSLVGLGSNVIRSVPGGVKVAGNPARQIGTVSL